MAGGPIEHLDPKREEELRKRFWDGMRPSDPYHSSEGDVHHTKRDCPHGNSIRPDRLTKGAGDKRECNSCSNI